MTKNTKNKTLADEIITLINSEANNNPAPTRCKIIKIYSDNIHADVETSMGILSYVECIGNNLAVGNSGVVIFLDGSLDEYIILTK